MAEKDDFADKVIAEDKEKYQELDLEYEVDSIVRAPPGSVWGPHFFGSL